MCSVEEGFPGAAVEGPFLLKGFDEGKSEAILLIQDSSHRSQMIPVIQNPLKGVSWRCLLSWYFTEIPVYYQMWSVRRKAYGAAVGTVRHNIILLHGERKNLVFSNNVILEYH
jgi:hypothetical protein